MFTVYCSHTITWPPQSQEQTNSTFQNEILRHDYNQHMQPSKHQSRHSPYSHQTPGMILCSVFCDDVETNQVEAHSPINPTIHYEMNHTRFFDHPKIFLILVGLVAVGVVYLITSNQSSPIEYGRYVSREEWGAAPPRGALTRRSQLATLVVIKHTWGDTCSNYDSCKSRVKDLQECHMNKIKLLDIAYNFLVGGDGRIYEGLGWGWENIVRNDSIDIAFIGDFNDAVPSDKMLSTAVYLIDLGWDEKWIDKNNYHVVGDNQTEPANSPGANLFAMLPRWFNHYSETALCFFGCSEERYSEPGILPHLVPQIEPPMAPKKTSKNWIISLSFLAFIGSLAGLTIGLCSLETATSEDITTELPETTTKFDKYGRIVPREGWGAEPPRTPLQTMNKAATLVVIKHTGGETCSNFLQCTQRVKDIQLEHFNVKNYRDISYNFLLGGDGRVYHGRGWRVMNEGRRNESVDFAFIGNFNDLKPSTDILNVANWLITVGMWEESPSGIHINNYSVISHNLTEPTKSPGTYLFAKMNLFAFHTFEMCYANCSDGGYVEAETCPPKEIISC